MIYFKIIDFYLRKANKIIELQCIRGNKQPDVYLEASVGGSTKRTGTILRSCDPVWEQGFTFLVSNPQTGVLHIKVIYYFQKYFLFTPTVILYFIYLNF